MAKGFVRKLKQPKEGKMEPVKLVTVELTNQTNGYLQEATEESLASEGITMVQPEEKTYNETIGLPKMLIKDLPESTPDGTALTIIKKDNKYLVVKVPVHIGSLGTVVLNESESKAEANERFKIEVVKHGIL